MSLVIGQQRGRILETIVAAWLLIIAGLALTRLLYEALFPRYLFLGRPLPALLITALLAGIAWFAWLKLTERRRQPTPFPILANMAALLPLLLNLPYLFDPAVNLAGGRFLFAASLWLTAVLLARQVAAARQWRRLGILFVWLALFPLYLLTMPAVVGRADTFEFQVVIPQLGIAHPTGYPLYILLGRLFAALPVGSIAWRINLASAVFATLAASLIYLAGRRLWKEPLAALLAAVIFGFTPTFWSQAVQAEVYALHALVVAGALWLMAVMLDHGARTDACSTPLFSRPLNLGWQRSVWLLALIIGFGLTNHLTTIILVPPALLTIWLAYGRCLRSQTWKQNGLLLLKSVLAFLLPLLLYAYLPLRWGALLGEPMGYGRFVDWVIGGRFQGALQLTAWLTDLTRYEIVWRLLLAEWGWFNLLLALAGLLYAFYRSWRTALVLSITCIGYVFYALNYHVPDLAVFLIPAHVVTALFWGAGIAAVLDGVARLLNRQGWAAWRPLLGAVLTLLLVLPSLLRTVRSWPDTGYADLGALQAWGEGVLSMPLEENAVILADSEKIAPLYYLQQAEGWRPDLEIMVLPDEAAYRAEVDARLAAGETVYLARFLPGLEGIYHLRSRGPLIEVSSQLLDQLPAGVTHADFQFDGLRLLGYTLEEPALVDSDATAVTLYWQAQEPSTQPQYIYTRWSSDEYEGLPDVPGGAHPAANTYPTVAFQSGEIVPDYHLLPRPVAGAPQRLDLQIATGPQFAAPEQLNWQTITSTSVHPAMSIDSATTYRAQNGRMLLTKANFQDEIRPGTPLSVALAGYAPQEDLLQLELLPLDGEVREDARPDTRVIEQSSPQPLLYSMVVDTSLPNGRYHLFASDSLSDSFCGWLAPASSGCLLGEVAVSGVPLPQDAANFADKLALLEIDLPSGPLQPGGVLPVQLQWQSLAAVEEDYTVFIQVLDEQDQIVGQIDAWPLHGTYPTSQWQPGEVVDDSYEIQLAGDLPPGSYRLQVGLYLLATLQRLPVLDADGRPVDDKVLVSGLASE